MLVDVAEQQREHPLLAPLLHQLLGHLLRLPLLVPRPHRHDPRALQRRRPQAAELLEALHSEDQAVEQGVAVLLATGLVVEGQFCVVADAEVGDEVLAEFLVREGLEGARGAVEAEDAALLVSKRGTWGSTLMTAVHMSILSPGELIHFFTLTSKSLLVRRDRSPNSASRQPA